jgi:hypothetical protein
MAKTTKESKESKEKEPQIQRDKLTSTLQAATFVMDAYIVANKDVSETEVREFMDKEVQKEDDPEKLVDLYFRNKKINYEWEGTPRRILIKDK